MDGLTTWGKDNCERVWVGLSRTAETLSRRGALGGALQSPWKLGVPRYSSDLSPFGCFCDWFGVPHSMSDDGGFSQRVTNSNGVCVCFSLPIFGILTPS